VPIGSLAPDEPPGPAAAPSLQPFELSFSTYHRLRAMAPALAALPAPPTSELAVVPIESLVYRGRRALERADVVRRALSGAMEAHLSFEAIEPLVSELIDLVPLALAE
jgi:hypothetical protein